MPRPCRPRRRARPHPPAIVPLARRRRSPRAGPLLRPLKTTLPIAAALRTRTRRRRIVRMRVIRLSLPLRVRMPRARRVNRKVRHPANRTLRRAPRPGKVLRSRATLPPLSPRARRQRPGRALRKKALRSPATLPPLSPRARRQRLRRVLRKKALQRRATLPLRSPRASRQRPRRAPRERAHPSQATALLRRSRKRQAPRPSRQASPKNAEPVGSQAHSASADSSTGYFFCLSEAVM
jgi:hypothetical protein